MRLGKEKKEEERERERGEAREAARFPFFVVLVSGWFVSGWFVICLGGKQGKYNRERCGGVFFSFLCFGLF